MMVKYYVVSLPRSGTTSICKMAKICGFNPIHAPTISLRQKSLSNYFNFFADTPVYCPSEIENILKYEGVFPKFIYIKRNFFEIFDSWNRVGLFQNYKKHILYEKELNFYKKFDLNSYQNAFSNSILNEENYLDIFQKHKEKIYSIIEKSNRPFLEYSFTDGWKPFCDFLEINVPDVDIPVLNKNKMFDSL